MHAPVLPAVAEAMLPFLYEHFGNPSISHPYEAAARNAVQKARRQVARCLFYGRGNPSTDEMIALVRRRRLPRVRYDQGQFPYIHLDDAVAATVAALDRKSSGSAYDIVDDRPTSFSEMVGGVAEAVGAPRPFTVPAWLLGRVRVHPPAARRHRARLAFKRIW
jgi:nucleoside-diphosphate-sugar epimerase